MSGEYYPLALDTVEAYSSGLAANAGAQAVVATAIKDEVAAELNLSGTYATKAEAGGGSSKYPMRSFGIAAAKIAAGTPTRLKWAYYGDSVSGKKFAQLYSPLKLALGGVLAGCYGTGPHEGVTVNATTGTITGPGTDWDLWVTGQAERYATGASRTYGVGGGAAVCDTIRVFYGIGPSSPDGGTFKIQVDGVDAPGFTNVSASGGSVTLGVATVSVTRGSHTVTVVNLTGAHRVVMVGFEDSTASGICPVAMGVGGIGLEQPQATAWAAFTAFLQTVAPSVLTIEMKDLSGTFGPALQSFFPAAVAGAPEADIVGIGSTPQSTNDADGVAQNTQLRDACTQYGRIYWDGYTPVKDYATMVAMGWQGDGTHVSVLADAYLASRMASDLGLWDAIGLSNPQKVNALTVRAANSLTIGTDQTAPNVTVVPVGGFDAGLRVPRWLRVYSDAAMTTEIARPISVSGGDPFLQIFTRFGGEAYTGVMGSSDGKLIEFVNNAGRTQVAHYAYAKFRGVIAMYARYVGGLAVPGGAVTFDLNTGNPIVVQITANCTSSSITNTYSDNQIITIGFRQDATGGRTYVWPTNCRFASGSAPSDTTLNTQTMVTFIWDGTVSRWHELSRSVAVPVT